MATKITKFIDRSNVRLLALDILAYLEPFLAERGLSGSFEGGDFAPTSAKMKLQFAVVSPEGEAMSREALAFKNIATRHGFQLEDLGREFRSGISTFRILGWNEQAVEYPIMTVNIVNGKPKKFTVSDVKIALSATRHNIHTKAVSDKLAQGYKDMVKL